MRLHDFFKIREATGQPLVLVTVIETEGSTYSKAGGHMVIDDDGNFCGMLSGGCLEGDLVERARDVISTGSAQSGLEKTMIVAPEAAVPCRRGTLSLAGDSGEKPMLQIRGVATTFQFVSDTSNSAAGE